MEQQQQLETPVAPSHPEEGARSMTRTEEGAAPEQEVAQDSYPFPGYRAVVTAHFPDTQSGVRAQEQLAVLAGPLSAQVVQCFEKQPRTNEWDDSQPGLAEGETALLVHLEDEAHGEAVISVCLTAGASRATFYPIQHVR
jgi:hypothetical protein